MNVSREDRIRMERAHVRAWPAANTANIGGWLWRSSGGGSQRANSVSTIDFAGNDLHGAVAAVEARYSAAGQPVRFQTFDDTAPPELAEVLRARGYQNTGATLTMTKPVTPIGCPSGVERHDHATDEWLDVYLGAITPDRRQANAGIVATIPRPSAFFALRRDSDVVSTALCVVSFGCAVIECVATRTNLRRQGAARELLAGLQSWAATQDADMIGLQVAQDNTAAIALYRQLGFTTSATNSFWSPLHR